MKKYNFFAAIVFVLLAAVFVVVNLSLISMVHGNLSRGYVVEINRISAEIEEKGLVSIEKLEPKPKFVTAIVHLGNEKNFCLKESESDYTIRLINGEYYRFDYSRRTDDEFAPLIITVNISMAAVTAITLLIIFYIRKKLVKPLKTINDVPYELSKGHLSPALKQSKNGYYSRFFWGLDLLREHLEKQKEKELKIQRDKKMLILSLSHDIKTPLSAIKLCSAALARNLYTDSEKRTETARSIGEKADEIEGFVSKIITASSEDFLDLSVNQGEFYIASLLDFITDYYKEKLSLLKIDFNVSKCSNCLLKGDLERATEVLQNIIENAIKYGDGKYINISVSSEEDCRLITIVNSGCTLPTEELSHIFESFHRGSNVGSNRGSGLGLYICRRLMTKMNGDIFAVIENGEMKVTTVFGRA